MRLIPSIDLRGGRCVRLLRGDFAAETQYDFEPHELLSRYRSLGATWLHIVDLDGARDGRLANRDVIVTLASQRAVNLQVGGGVRSLAVVDDLLRQGLDRVVVGSAAIEQPIEVSGWLGRFGSERICLALDVRVDSNDTPLIQTHGWTQGTRQSLWDVVEGFLAAGLKHVLCTDIDRDGALEGPNTGLYAEALQRYPQIAWQASGGVRDARDLAKLRALGVSAAVSGKALLEQRMTAAELAPYLT
jgi:phosphoribosylformimino-5-aminoimidazole carboxamide ribotide isomerase